MARSIHKSPEASKHVKGHSSMFQHQQAVSCLPLGLIVEISSLMKINSTCKKQKTSIISLQHNASHARLHNITEMINCIIIYQNQLMALEFSLSLRMTSPMICYTSFNILLMVTPRLPHLVGLYGKTNCRVILKNARTARTKINVLMPLKTLFG